MNQSELIVLSEVSLFRNIDIVELQEFFSNQDLSVKTYPKDQIILNQGDSCNELPVILTGNAGAFMTAPNGKLIRIETLTGPSAAATAVLFSTEHTYPVSLMAESHVSVLKIPKDTILSLMQEFPSFLEGYLTENGDKLLFLSEKIRLFQFKTLKQKIVGHILLLSGRQGSNEVRMMYSREDLSQLMAVARPSLSREISLLVSEGFLEVKGKTVRILNKKGLMALLSEGK